LNRISALPPKYLPFSYKRLGVGLLLYSSGNENYVVPTKKRKSRFISQSANEELMFLPIVVNFGVRELISVGGGGANYTQFIFIIGVFCLYFNKKLL
jgi:hypothetical protein